MKSKKYWVMGATAALVLVSSPAVAATLDNANGQSCGDGMGVWHFVNNQTGGAAAGTLNATFTDGTVWNIGASKVLANTQHFYVQSTGTVISAETNLPGRLVLSDFSCEDVKKK
jgi:hypothetical protein